MQQSIETRGNKRPAPISPTATHAADIQLADRYGVNRATIWRWAQQGKFPKPVKLSPGCTRWKLCDVESWEQEAKQGGAA